MNQKATGRPQKPRPASRRVSRPSVPVVGIVSHSDHFRAGVSSLLEFSEPGQDRWLAQIRVCDVMTKEVFIVHPDAAVRSAVQLMLDRRVGCLPVVEDGKLVGLLSERDCMHYLARLLELSEMRELLPAAPLE
jgi:CBS domain-containing protein